MASVARDGDVSPTAGTGTFGTAATGTWTPGPVTYTAYAKLTSDGAKAISGAQCTFSFAGSDSSGTAVAGQSTVTLPAGPTKLQRGEAGVVVSGDLANDSYGNTLTASSTAKLAE